MDDLPIDISKTSFFKPLGYQANNCGYCKRKHTSPSYYATSTRVTPGHYQELMDRGWRRSGQIYYKPDLPRSCCPHYTIRLLAEDFKPRRDQKRAVNRWNKYILGSEYIRKAAQLCPRSREEKRKRNTVFDLSTEIHLAEYSNVKRPVDPKTKKPIEPAHKFEVTIESDSLSERKWSLFQNYQMAIHKEPKSKNTKRTFERFLCSGLRRSTETDGGVSKRLGSYHMCYRLDGELIAIGVLDLLPHAVSSVYLIYDPKFDAFRFGKLSALREIAFTLEQSYKYYYMGYYIHSCVKMRYKADYRPQQILDPETLEWSKLDDEWLKQLDANRYYARSPHYKKPPEVSYHQGTDESDESEPEIPEASLFTLNVPGIMTREEVESKIDLDHWNLMLEGQLFELEDMRSWEQDDIMDPQSLKGIAGELAAALGPIVQKESVILLF